MGTTNSVIRTCPKCGGVGVECERADVTASICTECRGTGIVYDVFPIEVQCPVCGKNIKLSVEKGEE